MDELSSTHEEADTRMLLHAMKADETFQRNGVSGHTVVQATDTDVMVLLIHYYIKMKSTSEIWMRIGHINSTLDKRRYIPIHSISAELGKTFCQILPAVHCITGCDSVSSFFGIGKKKVMKVIENKGADYYADIAALGVGDIVASLKAAEKLVINLYEPKAHGQTNLRNLRLKFVQVKQQSLAKIPPSEPSFLQHVLRAIWQTQVWVSSHIAKPNIVSPIGRGWELDDDSGCIVPTYFIGQLLQK